MIRMHIGGLYLIFMAFCILVWDSWYIGGFVDKGLRLELYFYSCSCRYIFQQCDIYQGMNLEALFCCLHCVNVHIVSCVLFAFKKMMCMLLVGCRILCRCFFLPKNQLYTVCKLASSWCIYYHIVSDLLTPVKLIRQAYWCCGIFILLLNLEWLCWHERWFLYIILHLIIWGVVVYIRVLFASMLLIAWLLGCWMIIHKYIHSRVWWAWVVLENGAGAMRGTKCTYMQWVPKAYIRQRLCEGAAL